MEPTIDQLNDGKPPLVVAYGGGVNSTAMLVEMHRRGIRPALILFADTGGERPETYEAVHNVSAWCVEHGFPAVEIIRYVSKMHGLRDLEAQCLADKSLPSIAFGFKTCSLKYKGEPCDKRTKGWLKENGYHKATKAIGYDAGEERRAKQFISDFQENWYPLIEWGIHREECEAICVQAGLPTAKSSCFFCPSMKKHEILDLKKNHPDLLARALAMEANAELTSIKGLGRNFSWADFVKADEAQMRMFEDQSTPEIPCGCYDG